MSNPGGAGEHFKSSPPSEGSTVGLGAPRREAFASRVLASHQGQFVRAERKRCLFCGKNQGRDRIGTETIEIFKKPSFL